MHIEVPTSESMELIDVTDVVSASVPDEFDRGICSVFVPHTTAGVIVNEHENRLVSDFERMLATLAPDEAGYDHDAIDDNAAAHLRAAVLGGSVSLPVVNGALALGTWQAVLFVECDGPRTRRLRLSWLAG